VKVEPLQSVVMGRTEGENVKSTLWAVIEEDGRLEVQRSDYGKLVEEVWGRDEYEYNVAVAARYKDTVLLLLIKDFMKDDVAFRGWLEAKGVPFETSSWP
jgi:hypothetical protein